MIARSRRLPALVLLAAVPVWRPVLLGILISAVVHRTSLRLRGHVELDAARSELVFCTPPRSVATRIHVTGRLSTLPRTAPARARAFEVGGQSWKSIRNPPLTFTRGTEAGSCKAREGSSSVGSKLGRGGKSAAPRPAPGQPHNCIIRGVARGCGLCPLQKNKIHTATGKDTSSAPHDTT